MKKACILLHLLSIQFFSEAQFLVTKVNEDFYLQYDDGKLVTRLTNFTEEGVTSIPQKNCKASLTVASGGIYKDVYGRLDLITGNFIFTLKDKDMYCALPLIQIVFDSCSSSWNGAIFKNGYPAIEKQTGANFYQILNEGKATLLKYHQVKWRDEVPYNSTNTTRFYEQSVRYYLFFNRRMFKLEKNHQNLPALLGVSVHQLSTKKLDLKKEQDMVELIGYYNAL